MRYEKNHKPKKRAIKYKSTPALTFKNSELIAQKALIRCGTGFIGNLPFPLAENDTIFQKISRMFSL